jgi:putative nucleotidyltransferase with HDIG domain
MKENGIEWVAVDDLRVGLFVELESGWLDHPFPSGSFKIASVRQIDTLRELGLTRVRVNPSKSDPLAAATPAQTPLARSADRSAEQLQTTPNTPTRAEMLALQRRGLRLCERRFNDSVKLYRKTLEQVHNQPKDAAQQCLSMVNAIVDELLQEGESAIRLLSESAGDKTSMHSVNTTIVALLLGQVLGLSRTELVELGLAAFLHDIGKIELPDRVRWFDEKFTSAETHLYQEHVALGVQLGRKMGLSPAVLATMAQHHEMTDGTGFPLRSKGEAISRSGNILALVNRYDNLCNASRPGASMTPHQALSLMFTQFNARFDPATLGAFIRMMGVYPPGSVVQLADQRYALVVSVNAARPLKPRVLVYQPDVPQHEALLLDLERAPGLGIRRSLKPDSLPGDAHAYLAPAQRVNYFFERSADPLMQGALA